MKKQKSNNLIAVIGETLKVEFNPSGTYRLSHRKGLVWDQVSILTLRPAEAELVENLSLHVSKNVRGFYV